MEQNLYASEELYDWIRKRADAIKRIIDQKERDLAKYPANLPSGKIRASSDGRNHTREQYYWRKDSGEKTGTYIRKTPENKTFIQMMIQREYDQKLLKAAIEEYKYLLGGKRFCPMDSFRKAYDSMGSVKQKWVSPAIMSDEKYEEEWISKSPSNSQYKSENRIYKTKQGEEVRSKSELIIANTLFEKNIPYRYECPLTDSGRIWAVPDFTVLNVRERKEYYWEHFGMMGDSEYAINALKKIRNYEKHHMFPGTEMIYTFEAAMVQINVESIEDLVAKYFGKKMRLN
ncbi:MULTISPECIES: hypothetical protein [unclassified Bilifractor]|uniref:hypothetical protein n=1 Tax=unclassified Bilifractor TaxID=2815795 RepID=UPI003F93CFA4